MGIISVLLLLLILASFIFALIVFIRMLTKGSMATAESKKRSQLYLIVSAAVCALCLAFLFFSGKFYSMSMTAQMPYTAGIQSTGTNLSSDRTAIKLSSNEDFALTGDKAVTFHTGTGAYINFGQELVLLADSFIVQRLFKYSDQYIPREYRAANAAEVGLIVFVEHYASPTSSVYTNGARAFRHDIDVTICSDNRILAENTFQGNLYHETGGSDTLGPAPDEEASEWVAAQLAKFSAEISAAADATDENSARNSTESETPAAEDNSVTLTAADYAASLERAAKERNIPLSPSEHNGGTFYVYYFVNSITGDEGIDFEEQSAGLHVRTDMDKDSHAAADTLGVYSLVLEAAGVTNSSTVVVNDLLSILLDLPDDNGASIALEYPDDNLIVEVVPRAGKWMVNFTFA